MSMTYEDARDEFRRGRSRIYRCGDRTCGAPDCADCYSLDAAQRYVAEESEEETQTKPTNDTH